MKEITRIHIAKVAYDIETTAKKELEQYITTLDHYANDPELLQDIEIRITELFAERGITKDDVITHDDVAAIRQQLGEPEEFMGEGDIAVGADTENTSGVRRLYRDIDHAVLGGVMSGIAAYFKINPIWIRLAFIVLLFFSFGTAALVYVVLWLVIPPARTATEKLQLAGKPVTLNSIREQSTREEVIGENLTAKAFQRTLSVTLGITSIIAAIVTGLGTIGTAIAFTIHDALNDNIVEYFGAGGYEWLAWVTFSLLVVSGLLLTALFALAAYAFLKRTFTKRILVSAIIIIVLGIVSFAGAMGVAASQQWRVNSEAQSKSRELAVNVPANFSQVKTATIEVKTDANDDERHYTNANIRYVVSDSLRAEFEGIPAGIRPSITVDGQMAKISLTVDDNQQNQIVQPRLTVYGPALDAFTVLEAGYVSYEGQAQDTLTVIANKSASVSVSGSFKTLIVESEGSMDLSESSIEELRATTKINGTIDAGTVRSLTVTQPDVCPSNVSVNSTQVSVAAVTSETVTYNGATRGAVSYKTSCAALVVGDEENEDYSERYDS